MNKLKSILKYSILTGLMFYTLWLAFDNIDLHPDNEEFSGTFREKFNFIISTWNQSHFGWMLASALIGILSHFLRSERWKIQLEAIGYDNISSISSFLAVINGYFVNLVIPRGGEISRPVLLNKLEKVPTQVGIGSVVAERVIDLLLLVFLIGVVVISQLTKFKEFIFDYLNSNSGEQKTQSISPTIIIMIIVLGLIIFTSIFLYKTKKDLYLKLKLKGINLLVGLKEGLLSVLKLKKRALYIAYSLGIWICYFLMIYTMFKSNSYTDGLGLFDALTIFVVGGIAMAIPMPGGAGSYHLLVSAALLTLCSLPDPSQNTAFATIFHGWHTLVIIVSGLIGLVISQKLIKDVQLKE